MTPPPSSNAAEVPQPEETCSSDDFLKQLNDIMNEKVDDPVFDSLEVGGNDNDNGIHDEVEENQGSHKDENLTDSAELPEKGRSPVKVQFSGMEGPSPPPGLNLEEASRSELIAKLCGLQERLTQTQVDLKLEKTNRRKKEKNIFKMAKELGKRQVETTQKEEDILKVSRDLKSPLILLRTHERLLVTESQPLLFVRASPVQIHHEFNS